MTGLPTYEILALRYARHERTARDNFLGGDPHDGPMPLDYFVWAIRGAGRTIVVDTGFGERAARERNRALLRCPTAALREAGIDAATVEEVAITHLHYDHAGNLDKFPKARFHVQDTEVAYATGRHMCHAPLRGAFDVEDVVAMVRRVYDGRVVFHNGDAELAPGIELHHLGGHTQGLQVVRVRTARGWVVLASDASHFYANMRGRRPFPIVFHLGDMLAGYERLEALADGPDHIIPGHDPEVLRRYPPAGPDIVRLDLPPKE